MFSYSCITDYHQQLNRGLIDCAGTVEYYLRKIEENKALNAIVEVFAEEARQQALRLDEKRKRGEPSGKLHGVIITIKDVICYKDHKVTAASKALQNFVSLYTATALQHLIDEEAIIIGRCNCDEFAMGSSNENSAYGPVLNAADNSRVPGGSSGGSAVAVQAGLCMISLGSDTGGSVRQPADFCGIIGFKPGYGSISRYGLIAYASSFDQIGVMGTSLEDVALVTEIMSRPDPMDATMNQQGPLDLSDIPTAEPGKIKYCYFRQMLEHPSLDDEIRKNMLSVISQLKEKGYQAEELEFPFLDYIVPAYYLLTTAEASSNLSRYDGIRYGLSLSEEKDLDTYYAATRSAAFGKEVKRRIMLGSFVLSAGYYDTYFGKAQKLRRLLLEQTKACLEKYDVIILPVSPTTAFKAGAHDKDPVAMYLADIFTVFANLTGTPAIALPLFKHSDGMPFGLQLMAASKNERMLLSAANTLMSHAQQRGIS